MAKIFPEDLLNNDTPEEIKDIREEMMNYICENRCKPRNGKLYPKYNDNYFAIEFLLTRIVDLQKQIDQSKREG